VAGAQQFILEKVPAWLRKYGPNGEKVAFFCTNDAQTEPLIKQLLASRNGLFVEADLPSPLMGYPGALGLDLKKEAGNFPAILRKVQAGVLATVSAGLGEYAIRVVEGKARRNSLPDLFAAYGKWTPGAKWNGALYTDTSTGVKVKNLALVYMDTYIFGGLNGQPFLPTTSVKVPAKYYAIRRH
jgi:hypothetical protein